MDIMVAELKALNMLLLLLNMVLIFAHSIFKHVDILREIALHLGIEYNNLRHLEKEDITCILEELERKFQ
jgi:hypothetical protein